jgi:hypothetical protein
MALPWVRLDTQWPQNPKFLQLAEDKKWRAITTYMAGLAWSGSQGQAGFVPYYALLSMHGTRKEAHELVEVGLWHQAEGGFEINDWADYQPSNEEHQARSERARIAAQKRWANR